MSSEDLTPPLAAHEAELETPGEGSGGRLGRLSPPSRRLTSRSLLRADFVSQGRNMRALLGTLVLPVVYVVALSAGKGAAALGGPKFGRHQMVQMDEPMKRQNGKEERRGSSDLCLGTNLRRRECSA